MTDENNSTPLRNHLLVLAGICLIALNLRPVVTAVPPVLETIRFDLDISHAVVSLLTTIPILLMGVCSLQAARVSRKIGPEQGVFWSVIALTLASALRVWGDIFWILMVSTVIGGVSVAIGQTLLSGVMKRYFPNRAAFVMGLYTSMIIAGAAISSGFTAPLSRVLDGWTWGLAFWALPCLIAIFVWIPSYLRANRKRQSGVDHSTTGTIPWNKLGAWWITALFTIQGMIFVSVLTWVAPYYVSLGWSEIWAGYLLSLFMWIQLIGSLTIPALADRYTDRRPWLYLTVVLIGLGLVGLTFSPTTFPWIWVSLVGMGLGAQFPLSLTLPLDYADDPSMASQITSMTFGVGYTVASIGPFVIGTMLDRGFGYTVSFVLLTVLTVLMGGIATRFQPGTLEDLSPGSTRHDRN